MHKTSSTTLADCVVLFDIDGTLVTGPSHVLSPGVVAMETAAQRRTGCSGLHERVEMAGRTDRQIARDLLVAGGQVNPTDNDVACLIDVYIEVLEQQVLQNPYCPIGDVRCAVEALRAAGCLVALGTGNVVRGARAKLASAGLLDAFDSLLGGFGDDAEARDELLLVGTQRCDPSGHKVVVVVGDTPHDVHAARAIGALCVAVTTGSYDEQALQQAGADVVVAQLDASLVVHVETLLRLR